MITTKIKALFQFIEYLHSNIDNFKQYDQVFNELDLLVEERNKVSPQENFKDKFKYDEVQAEINEKWNVIWENISTPIENKANDLKVCSFKNQYSYNWNGVQTDINNLKDNFSDGDLPEIFSFRSKYLEYRTETKREPFLLPYLFSELNDLLSSLFDFFKEGEQSEIKSFETETIQVDDLREVVEQMLKGNRNVSSHINLQPNQNIPQWKTHERLFEAVIFSANEEQKKPIAGAYERIKETWFFLNSDIATFNGKQIEKFKRPLLVNPIIAGKPPEFDKYFDAEITYCSTQNRIMLIEQDFINDICKWIELKSNDTRLSITQKRKCNELLEYIKNKALPPQQNETKGKQETPTFINNFDNIHPAEIYKHFKAGLVDKKYLTEQELIQYLKAAFELKTIPETLFKIKDAPTKATINAVFYTYYKNVTGKVQGKQPQYAALLGNYFEGYRTETVSSNFSKSIY